jgi:hypothetical protein
LLPITEYYATAYCGNPILNYTGFNAYNFQPLNYATDMISVDPNTGSIKFGSKKAPGLYKIKVRGVLSLVSSYIDKYFEIRINEPSYPSILPEPLPFYPFFLPEPLIVEIVEVIAGLKKEI